MDLNQQTPPHPANPQTPDPKAQNLIPNLATNQSRSGSAGSSWKSWIFTTIATILAAVVGYACILRFGGGIKFWVFVLIASLFFLSSFFNFLLTHDPRRRALSALLQVIAFLAFFYSIKPGVLAGAFLVLAVFYFLADRSATLIFENSLKFRLAPVAKIYMKRVFTGFALAGILLYLPQWNSGSIFVSSAQFQKWYNGVADSAERFYAGIDLNGSAGSFAEGVARLELSNDQRFRDLSKADQERAVKAAAKEIVMTTSQKVGFVIAPEMAVADIFYRYILDLLAQFQSQSQGSFAAIWAIALFVIIWSVGSIFIWVVICFAKLLYELLLAMDVLRVAGETRTKEVIELA